VKASLNGGRSFRSTRKVGPPGTLRHAAVVCQDCGTRFAQRGRFLGDYMALSAARGAAYAVWARSAAPPSGAGRHQRIWSTTLSFVHP
jgi:hypothetical protein